MKTFDTRTYGVHVFLLSWMNMLNFCSPQINVYDQQDRPNDLEQLPSILYEAERILNSRYGGYGSQGGGDIWRNVEKFENVDELENPDYSNEWVLTLLGGQRSAERLARETGYEFLGPVLGFEDTYIFRKADHPQRSKREAKHYTKRLADDNRVIWVEQQVSKKRMKRDNLMDNVYNNKLINDVDILFNDPFWPKQWPLHDTRTMQDLPKLDLHVLGAWKKNYTGRGVVVTILDDGIQWNHTDLAQNYDPQASFDLNDNDTDPMPTFNDYNKHGTRCAGEVAMVANNRVCGVGVAFNAKIGGIRMLDGRITDRLEAEALQFNIQHVDIYSASWGPNDDGRTVEGPGTLAERAILNGIKNGRNGKGVIYIWASGNGGSFDDDCDCDGYSDSIYTLSISSAAQSGKFPWYGEKCASTIATTYSSGAYTDQKITTTDIRDQCTTDHTGTSASAPLAAGIVALGLEANPRLTWRDVQHLAVFTSEPAPLIFNPDWHRNGRGLLSNTRFGFGLMNAEAFVTAAEKWTNVPAQKICTTTFPNFVAKKFSPNEPGVVNFNTDSCKGQNNEVNYLEHVQLVSDIDYTRRGNLAIYLTSPNGTRTKILSPRKRDSSATGFRRWPFTSVHTWGENPEGWWRMEVYDTQSENGNDNGAIKNLTLILYGTTEMPEHYKEGRKYDMDYNQVHDRAIHEQELRKAQIEQQMEQLRNSLIQKIEPSTDDDERRYVAETVDGDTKIDSNNYLFRQQRRASFDSSLASSLEEILRQRTV